MLSEFDIENYYKEQFNIDAICHVCDKNKLCIKDGIEGSQFLCFICFDCDTKRHNEENKYERLHQR